MAKWAFDHCAEDYAYYRPAYPDEVFEILTEDTGGPARGCAADVGAGTGIFARRLASFGWVVVAVEPSVAMLRRVSGVDVHRVCATAEATGLGDASVGLVMAAQAFHWFNPRCALAEFARVLKPGGVLALCWNNRAADRSEFVAAYEALIARHNTSYNREYRQQDWPGKIAASGDYAPAEYHRVAHVWRVPADAMVGFSRSVSYIRRVLSREELPRFEEELRGIIARRFGAKDCHVPLRTDLRTARRL